MSAPWCLMTHHGLQWPAILNPIILLVLYYTMATIIRQLFLSETGTDLPEVEVYTIENSSEQANMEANLQNVESDGSEGNNNCLPVQMYSSPEYTQQSSSTETFTEMEIKDEDSGNPPSNMTIISHFIMHQSYICALIFMMIWSITYISWLTFVLLIWSCVIWMLRDSQRWAKLSSPFLTVYGNLLLTQQFITGLELTEAELFPTISNTVLIDFDLKHSNTPCIHLGAKVIYTFTFWLLLRQHLTEKEEMRKRMHISLSEINIQGTESTQIDGTSMAVLGSVVKGFLIKYWIYFCTAMFIIISFHGRVVVYKILYIVLFLFCVALYQVHYDWWRQILRYFWITVVSYSMLVLITIYTYQFQTVSWLFQQKMGMSEDSLKDLGLEQYDTAELFANMSLPATFLLACILQLHYFHDHFLNLTDWKHVSPRQDDLINRHRWLPCLIALEKVVQTTAKPGFEPKESILAQETGTDIKGYPSPWSMVIDRLTTLFLRFLEKLHKVQVWVWRFLELHIIKMVSSFIIWITLKEVSLMNYLFLIVWVFALPYSSFRPLASSISTVWACVMIVCKMMYQLKVVKLSTFSANCTLALSLTPKPLDKLMVMDTLGYFDIERISEINGSQELLSTSALYAGPIDPTYWYGALKKCEDDVLPCLKNHLIILGLLVFEMTVYRHQQYYRLHNGLKTSLTGTLLDNITRLHLDDGLLNCIKYFTNYFFYKFGLELCFMAAIHLIGQRMDLYSAIHALWLIVVLCRRRRKAIAEIWPKYCCFVACIIPFQYLLCIGIPPSLCKAIALRQIGSCVYLKSLLEKNCWVVQTFGMACTIKDYNLPNKDDLLESCEVPNKQAGIIWDSTCFLFLLAQRRVFLSYYFLHVVADLKASKLLAARGAELFEAKVKKGVTARLEKESLSMEMLKKQ
ncbi:hypothetical protein chiPu_0015638 [Chiloscyllium punctatum]|uniref:Uncharacterized protein n=1 Tax=Chiloscyllium punctatum TaxID=137246 RepID=A0A401T3H2_CHIPU|nr:hypothetical protein [Chiloscyllium punctatum]